MAQKILIVLTALAALVLNIAQANSAQLSTNPWLEANDDEAVAEVYRKEHQHLLLFQIISVIFLI